MVTGPNSIHNCTSNTSIWHFWTFQILIAPSCHWQIERGVKRGQILIGQILKSLFLLLEQIKARSLAKSFPGNNRSIISKVNQFFLNISKTFQINFHPFSQKNHSKKETFQSIKLSLLSVGWEDHSINNSNKLREIVQKLS